MIDGQGAKAYTLGLVKGCEYQGLNVAGEADKFYSQLQLSNCFVTTMTLLDVMEVTWYNIKNMFGGWGNIKIIEVMVHNLMQVVGDSVVNYQYCGFDRILTQAKEMAGADYAAIANNSSRAVLVFLFENPEMRAKARDIMAAVQCVQRVASEVDLSEGDDDDRGDGEVWDNIGAEELEAAQEALECFSVVNEFELGQITGVFFAHTFNTLNQTE